MTRTATRTVLFVAGAVAAAALAGCFDSVVGGRCAEGWVAEGDVCRPAAGGDVDAGDPLAADAAPDGEATSCGVCPSGVCRDGVCVGAVAGHVVLVGHDYRVHHAASARLLGNAAALGAHPSVRVALLVDDVDATTSSAVRRALDAGLAAMGRTWSPVAPEAVADGDGAAADIVLVGPRTGSAAAASAEGERWRPALAAFVAAGGTVIGLEGPGGSTTDFLRGAMILDVTLGAPATGGDVAIAAPTDALAVGVGSPYPAELGSVTFATTGGAVVVATSAGAPVVLHTARLP